MSHSCLRVSLASSAAMVLLGLYSAAFAQEPQNVPLPKNLEETTQQAAPVAPVFAHNDSVLLKALAFAYEHNPQLEAQRKAQNSVDERVPQALAGALPAASIGYEKGRRRSSQGGGWTYLDAEAQTLNVSQPLFRGGQTWANTKSARREVEAGRARLHAVEQEVLLNTATAYMDVVQAKSVVELSRKNLDVLEKQLVATSQRFKVGEDTRTDVAQAEARVAAAKSQLTTNEGRLANAQAAFERFVGYKPEAVVMPTASVTLPTSLEETLKLAEASNPRILEASKLKESSDHQIDANAGRLLPSADIRGAMSRQEGVGFLNRGFDQDELLLTVSMPLFQNGAEYSRVRAAKEEYQRRRFTEIDAVVTVKQEATSAWESWQAAKASLESDQAAIAAAKIALEGVRQEQQYGTRTTLDVLDAERELFDSEVRYVASQRNEVVAKYSLLAAIGQLTAESLKLDVAVYDPEDHFNDVEYQFIGF
jgi:outer membrane protein